MRSKFKAEWLRRVLTAVGLLLLAAYCPPPPAPGQYAQPPMGPVPTGKSAEVLKQVNIEQRLGNQIPLDLKFRDESGREVRLGEYFGKGRPVALTVERAGPTLTG